MKKEHYYKFFYGASLLLIIGFGIRLGADYMMYNPQTTSAPFSVLALERTLEFILPSLLIFLLGTWMKKKDTK